jgi:hypothetical protein
MILEEIMTTNATKKLTKKQPTNSNDENVAKANDEFRRRLRNDDDHKVVLTPELSASGLYSAAIAYTRAMNDFGKDYPRRDFGVFDMKIGEKIGYFKIEYFETDDWGVLADPALKPAKRKITIGLGEP